LIEANIDAFKIEGRMRHPHYVETVSKVYREAIEAYYDGTFSEKNVGGWVTELKKVYNRGFTPGFYFKRMTEEDQQHNYSYNLSHYRYIRIGQVDIYDPNTRFASISLDNGYLSKNDEIIIMGRQTDTYIHQIAKEIKYQDKLVSKTPRGTKNAIISVELKVNNVTIGDGRDKIYVFTDKTYDKKVYSL
jgi:putative protease